jgi:hypothetical protein
MILTEESLNFRREGDRWRSVEHPELLMLEGGVFVIDGEPVRYLTARDALARLAPPAPERTVPRPRSRTKRRR